jgi:thiamine monophosphate kinase
MKGTPPVERFDPPNMEAYGRICGWTLTRSHARSGDPIAIAGYLGKGDVFDRAITEFAEAYATQNDKDYEQFLAAIDGGRIPAVDD